MTIEEYMFESSPYRWKVNAEFKCGNRRYVEVIEINPSGENEGMYTLYEEENKVYNVEHNLAHIEE